MVRYLYIDMVDIMLWCYLSILCYIILHTILPTLFFTINQGGSYSAILPTSTTYSYFGVSVFTDEKLFKAKKVYIREEEHEKGYGKVSREGG